MWKRISSGCRIIWPLFWIETITKRQKNHPHCTAPGYKKKGTITITGKGAGTAKITVKAGKVTEMINVEVKPAEFNLSATAVNLNYKEKQQDQSNPGSFGNY